MKLTFCINLPTYAKLVKNFHVAVGKHDIQCVEKVKYLGAIFDKNLSWNAHIDNIIKKTCICIKNFFNNLALRQPANIN